MKSGVCRSLKKKKKIKMFSILYACEADIFTYSVFYHCLFWLGFFFDL